MCNGKALLVVVRRLTKQHALIIATRQSGLGGDFLQRGCLLDQGQVNLVCDGKEPSGAAAENRG